jgi:hypothetical protein
MNAAQLLEFLTRLTLVFGASGVLWKGIDELSKYLNKRKTQALQLTVDELRRDVEEIKKTSVDNRMWIQKLEKDLDDLTKLLLDKFFKK